MGLLLQRLYFTRYFISISVYFVLGVFIGFVEQILGSYYDQPFLTSLGIFQLTFFLSFANIYTHHIHSIKRRKSISLSLQILALLVILVVGYVLSELYISFDPLNQPVPFQGSLFGVLASFFSIGLMKFFLERRRPVFTRNSGLHKIFRLYFAVLTSVLSLCLMPYFFPSPWIELGLTVTLSFASTLFAIFLMIDTYLIIQEEQSAGEMKHSAAFSVADKT